MSIKGRMKKLQTAIIKIIGVRCIHGRDIVEPVSLESCAA